jgi:hypothetical protein
MPKKKAKAAKKSKPAKAEKKKQKEGWFSKHFVEH